MIDDTDELSGAVPQSAPNQVSKELSAEFGEIKDDNFNNASFGDDAFSGGSFDNSSKLVASNLQSTDFTQEAPVSTFGIKKLPQRRLNPDSSA